MAEYDNRNRFTLFRNTKKREGKNDPDFRGTFTDEHGREFWMDAWATTPKSGGDKFLSGPVKLKEERKATSAPTPPPKRVELEDEVPF